MRSCWWAVDIGYHRPSLFAHPHPVGEGLRARAIRLLDAFERQGILDVGYYPSTTALAISVKVDGGVSRHRWRLYA